MKNEIKFEYNDSKKLENLIQKSYFKNDQKGKLLGKKNYIEVVADKDDVTHTIIKGLHNITVKLTNDNLIDGTMRFIIDESNQDKIKMYPISIYCILSPEKKYCFY